MCALPLSSEKWTLSVVYITAKVKRIWTRVYRPQIIAPIRFLFPIVGVYPRRQRRCLAEMVIPDMFPDAPRLQIDEVSTLCTHRYHTLSFLQACAPSRSLRRYTRRHATAATWTNSRYIASVSRRCAFWRTISQYSSSLYWIFYNRHNSVSIEWGEDFVCQDRKGVRGVVPDHRFRVFGWTRAREW